MDSRWRRVTLIVGCSALCFFDLALDICYFLFSAYSSTSLETVSLAFLILQPAVYYVYFQLGLFAYCICDRESKPYRWRLLFAMLFQAPFYTVLAEFKLLMSPLYVISLPQISSLSEDRIKHDLLGPVVVHCLLESVPMSIIQAYNNTLTNQWEMTQTLSLCTSCACSGLGVFVTWVIIRMNTGGLWWINTPKADIYLMTKMSYLKIDNQGTSSDN